MGRYKQEMRELNEQGIPKGIAQNIIPVTESGCWIWIGGELGRPRSRYGSVWFGGRHRAAHRVVYELLCGAVKDGLVLDHLCRVTLCCNPAHLEPVPNKTNILRGVGVAAQLAKATHCKRGHELSGENLRVDKRNFRRCVTCLKEQWRQGYHRMVRRNSPEVQAWKERS